MVRFRQHNYKVWISAIKLQSRSSYSVMSAYTDAWSVFLVTQKKTWLCSGDNTDLSQTHSLFTTSKTDFSHLAGRRTRPASRDVARNWPTQLSVTSRAVGLTGTPSPGSIVNVWWRVFVFYHGEGEKRQR